MNSLFVGLVITPSLSLDATRFLQAAVYAAIATNVIAASVNHYVTKISVHVAALAGCAAVLALVSTGATQGVSPGFVGGILVMLTVLQGWARVYLGRHTVGQVLLGWGVAVVCVGVVFGQLLFVVYR